MIMLTKAKGITNSTSEIKWWCLRPNCTGLCGIEHHELWDFLCAVGERITMSGGGDDTTGMIGLDFFWLLREE